MVIPYPLSPLIPPFPAGESPPVALRHSVGIALFRAVFLFYCLIAVVVTAASLVATYDQSRDRVELHLTQIREAFEKTLANALWEMNTYQVEAVIYGISKNPVIAGIALHDPQGRVLGRMGELPPDEGDRPQATLGLKSAVVAPPASLSPTPLQRFAFPLVYRSGEREERLGELNLYWNRQIILDEVHYEFILLVAGAIVKTLGLWGIFIYFNRPMLLRPLGLLTEAIAGLSQENLDRLRVRIPTRAHNEFNVLADHFNGMAGSLHAAYALLKEQNATLIRQREELQHLSARLEAIREEEKKRIAGEIHDELGSILTRLKMDLARLNQGAARRGETTIQVEELHGLTDLAIQTVRRISRSLRPRILDQFGLLAALEWLALQHGQHTGSTCDVDPQAHDLRLDDVRQTALFRICQESLTNVARHAGASRVAIDLRLEAETILLAIRDDGRGITPEQAGAHTSFGIGGMRERAAQLGGDLRVEAVSPSGTRVTVRIPRHPSDRLEET